MAAPLTKEEKQAAKEAELSLKLQAQAAEKELAARQAAEKAALDAKLEADRAAAADNSPSKAEYKKLIEAYKAQNPIKYEAKKDEFAKKLAALK
jgi:hypothetical protein